MISSIVVCFAVGWIKVIPCTFVRNPIKDLIKEK